MRSSELPSSSESWVENSAPSGRLPRLGIRQLWDHRELTYFFALRDVKVRYKQAYLGVSWAVLQPLAGAAAFTILFNRVAGIEGDGGSYFGFALAGFVVWSYFSGGLGASSSSLVGNAELITKVPFPKLVTPVASLLPGLVDLALGITLALVFTTALGTGTSILGFFVALPLGTILLLIATFGPGLFLSALIVKYHDAGSLVTFGLQLLLFISPVGYPPELVDQPWQDMQYLNPVTGSLGLYRVALAGSPMPSVLQLALSAVAALVLAIGGLWYFRANEREFADII